MTDHETEILFIRTYAALLSMHAKMEEWRKDMDHMVSGMKKNDSNSNGDDQKTSDVNGECRKALKR